jgi:hypothetical protein
VIGTALVDYPDVAELRHTGPLPTGIGGSSRRLTAKLPATKDGYTRAERSRLKKRLEELSDSPLGPSLFELPERASRKSATISAARRFPADSGSAIIVPGKFAKQAYGTPEDAAEKVSCGHEIQPTGAEARIYFSVT